MGGATRSIEEDTLHARYRSFAAAPSSMEPARRPLPGTVLSKAGHVGVGGRQVPLAARSTRPGFLVTPDGWTRTPTMTEGHVGPRCWRRRAGTCVTTAIFGNCGVGFARVRPQHRAALMELMEGVEEFRASSSPTDDLGLGDFPSSSMPGAPAARDRYRGSGRASPFAGLIHGRPRHSARSGDPQRISARCGA